MCMYILTIAQGKGSTNKAPLSSRLRLRLRRATFPKGEGPLRERNGGVSANKGSEGELSSQSALVTDNPSPPTAELPLHKGASARPEVCGDFERIMVQTLGWSIVGSAHTSSQSELERPPSQSPSVTALPKGEPLLNPSFAKLLQNLEQKIESVILLLIFWLEYPLEKNILCSHRPI